MTTRWKVNVFASIIIMKITTKLVKSVIINVNHVTICQIIVVLVIENKIIEFFTQIMKENVPASIVMLITLRFNFVKSNILFFFEK